MSFRRRRGGAIKYIKKFRYDRTRGRADEGEREEGSGLEEVGGRDGGVAEGEAEGEVARDGARADAPTGHCPGVHQRGRAGKMVQKGRRGQQRKETAGARALNARPLFPGILAAF